MAPRDLLVHPFRTAQQDSIPVWRLREPPLFLVTESDGSDGGRAWQSTVGLAGSALIGSDQTVIVSNSDQLLYLDDRGRALATAGRAGDGPGEFRGVNAVFAADGRVGTFDSRQGRIALFSPSGIHERTYRVDAPVPSAAAGWLSGIGAVSVSGRDGEPRRYVVHDTLGSVLRTFTGPTQPLSEVVTYRSEGRGLTSRPFLLLECQPRVLHAVIDSTLYIVDSPANRVLSVSPTGEQVVIYQSPRRPTVSDAAFERVRSTARNMVEGGASAPLLARLVREFGEPGDPLPATWYTVVADPDGRLFLRLSPCGRPDALHEWEVIDTSGNFLGMLRANRTIRAVRGDLAVAISSDPFQQLYVGLYRMEPTTP